MNDEITAYNSLQDALEVRMLEYPKVDCPVDHVFTEKLYSRSICMPTGTLVSSRIHLTEHQFVVSKGCALVKINEEEWRRIEAPFLGVTEPGTRRLLYILEDCVWTTFHVVDIEPTDDSELAVQIAVDKIDEMILDRHVNELAGGQLKNNNLIKSIENEA